LRLWIGHYYENPKEWFVVWANYLRDAWDVVDQVGSPETSSFRELISIGIVNFHVHYEGDEPKFSPSKNKELGDKWLTLGDQGLLENPIEYIRIVQSEKEANQKFKMKIWRGSYSIEKKKNDEEGFIVWAKNKQDALLKVNQLFGNVDENSLVEIREEGFVDFNAATREGQLLFTPPKDDVKSGFWIDIGIH
jgi:hypothetical protein